VKRLFIVALLFGFGIAGCQTTRVPILESYEVMGQQYHVLATARGYQEEGIASWYGPNFHGHKTATGEIYDMTQMTAAHKTLPLPCFVEVKNTLTNKRIIVRVNDRGPYHEGRIIDLSESAAKALDVIGPGTAPVEVRTISHLELEALKPDTPKGEQVFVQIGAYSNLETARQMLADIKAQTAFSPNIDKVTSPTKSMYRLRVGPLYDFDAGQDVVNALAFAGVSSYQLLD